jgi:hypothetical protein
MSGLGGVFFALGVIFLATSNAPEGGQDGTFVFLGGLFGLMGLAFIGVDLFGFRRELKKDRLRVSGLKGTARVVRVSDSNITVNNNPLVNLDLDVTVPGQQPFRTRKRTVISRLSVGALVPGGTIPVLADPANPRDIVLDWEGGVSPSVVGDQAAFAGALPDTVRAEVLRRVGDALAAAANRADQAGTSGLGALGGGAALTSGPGAPGTVTILPDGHTTIIDGGTTLMINGRAVPMSELGGSLAGLPAAIAAALRLAGGATAIPGVGSGSVPGTAPGGAPAPIPGLASMPTSAPLPRPGFMDIDAAARPSAGQGTPARVTLDTIQDTGTDIGGNRLYTFDLTVSVAGRQSYQTKHAAVVPDALVPRLIRGASFPAEVDPAQPAQISVHWDR